MKDLIVRIIGENRVKAGLDSAKTDIQKFSDAGKTFVKSLKDELSSIASNIPGLGNLTRAFGGAFTVAIGGAVALGTALRNAIQDSAAAWKDFQMSIDRDFTRMSKSAIEFNAKFTKAKESGSPEITRELVTMKQKEREDLLAEIRALERERDTAGLGTQFARASRNAGKAANEALGVEIFGEGWFGKQDARNEDMLAAKQNDLALIDRQIALARELDKTNAMKAAENLRGRFANVGNDVFSESAMKAAMNGTDAEREVAANQMLDSALAKLKNLQGVSMPTEDDIEAKRAAMQQFVDASELLDELKRKAAQTPGDTAVQDPGWHEQTIKAWQEELKRLSAPIEAIATDADAKPSKADAESVAMAQEAARTASRVFQSISVGDAFESAYGQRGNRDPAERTAAAAEKSLEVLKKIESKTGAAP